MTEKPRAYTDKDRRSFGLVLGGLLGLVALRSWRHGGAAWRWVLPAALAASAAALLAPGLLSPVLSMWMKAAGVMAEVNTAVLMAVLWALVFVPSGLVMRAFGADPLDLRMRTGESYWREREPRAPGSYTRLF